MVSVPTFRVIHYFDRSIIRTNWKRINRGPIQKAGLIVALNARQSIRKVGKKGKPSKAGRPPHHRGTKSGGTPEFHQIFSIPTFGGASAIIGMVGFGGEPVPGLMEHGGMARRRVFEVNYRKKGYHKNFKMKPKMKTVRYPQRKFMQPALEKTKRRLPELWRNSIK